MLITNLVWIPPTLCTKILLLCSTEESHTAFEATCGGINDGKMFIFGQTNPLFASKLS